MDETKLCPFSKPIIGQWCRCPHARLADRCSGKMLCAEAATHLAGCHHLEQVLRDNTRFVLGLGKADVTLTHAQSMKVRCGGIEGMARVLGLAAPPEVLQVIAAAQQAYGELENFPFQSIVSDVQAFSHRKSTPR